MSSDENLFCSLGGLGGVLLVWIVSEGRGLVWRGHLYWAVGSPVYVGYVVASGGLGFFN